MLVTLLTPSYNFGAESPGAPVWERESDIGQPLFTIKTFRRLTATDGLDRIDVAVEIVNDMLQFLREDSHYTASVEVSLQVTDSHDRQAFRQVRRLEQKADRYEQTNSQRDFINTIFSAELPPGSYIARVYLTDLESQHQESKEAKINIPGPAASAQMIDLSDLMLARSTQLDAATRLPEQLTLSGNLSDQPAGLYCFFDVRRNQPMTSSYLRLTIQDQGGTPTATDSMALVGGETLGSYFMSIRTADLKFNRYDVTLSAVCDGDTVIRRASFRISRYGMPGSVRDIDQAIRQLRYIAGDDEIKQLMMDFPSQREESFLRFWNDHFPTPGEAVNGKMIEYYKRVEYANEHFGNNREGWATDRGQVSVIYGLPNDLERRLSDDQSVAYEIWYYRDLNKRFVFKDEYGFGDFRLTTPLW